MTSLPRSLVHRCSPLFERVACVTDVNTTRIGASSVTQQQSDTQLRSTGMLSVEPRNLHLNTPSSKRAVQNRSTRQLTPNNTAMKVAKGIIVPNKTNTQPAIDTVKQVDDQLQKKTPPRGVHEKTPSSIKRPARSTEPISKKKVRLSEDLTTKRQNQGFSNNDSYGRIETNTINSGPGKSTAGGPGDLVYCENEEDGRNDIGLLSGPGDTSGPGDKMPNGPGD
jgi:hypothetical protein